MGSICSEYRVKEKHWFSVTGRGSRQESPRPIESVKSAVLRKRTVSCFAEGEGFGKCQRINKCHFPELSVLDVSSRKFPSSDRACARPRARDTRPSLTVEIVFPQIVICGVKCGRDFKRGRNQNGNERAAALNGERQGEKLPATVHFR
jgi:hypothetical protein